MIPPVWWDVATLTITEAPRAEYTLGKDLNKSLHVPGNPAALEQSESIFNRDIPWLVFHFAPPQGCSAKLPRGGKPVRYPPFWDQAIRFRRAVVPSR